MPTIKTFYPLICATAVASQRLRQRLQSGVLIGFSCPFVLPTSSLIHVALPFTFTCLASTSMWVCDLCIQSFYFRGAWVAQSVEGPTSAQVMISRFVGLSPVSGSVLTAQSLEPASGSVTPSLCPSPTHTLSLSLPLKNKKRKKERKKERSKIN